MFLLSRLSLVVTILAISHSAASGEVNSSVAKLDTTQSLQLQKTSQSRLFIAHGLSEKDFDKNETMQNNIQVQQAADGKRCMMVCIRWGEDCVISPKTGKRTCRRVCEEFGEQCF